MTVHEIPIVDTAPTLGAAAPVSAVMSAVALTVEAEESVSVACELAKRADVRHLPVMSGSRGCIGLVGLDELQVWADGAAGCTRPPIGVLIDRPDVRIRPAAPVVEAARLMAAHQTDALLVVDGERLVGLLTWRDVVRWVAGMADSDPARRGSRPALFAVPTFIDATDAG